MKVHGQNSLAKSAYASWRMRFGFLIQSKTSLKFAILNLPSKHDRFAILKPTAEYDCPFRLSNSAWVLLRNVGMAILGLIHSTVRENKP